MSLTREQRQQIVNEAMSWVKAKTPYRGWSHKKGVGADCGQLLYAVFHSLGLIPTIELPKDYRIDVAQHRASTEYVDLVAAYMREIPESEAQTGDVVVYKLGLAYAHAGIIVRWPDKIIDAQLHGGVKVRHGMNQPKFSRASKKFFTLRNESIDRKDATIFVSGVSTDLRANQ
jgi:cell wall-associated NlpC family hydrolase